ncbi:hypothetical protein IJV79_00805, partial [bacterium]|nr:hypothetical protein [bacterium]
DIYNKDGQKMRTFFIRDMQLAHVSTSESKYFIWDRYNLFLKTHFYSHNCMLETVGNPDYRYGMLIESESIMPKDYEIFEKHKNLAKDFDLIFTYSAKLLDTLDNARFVPFAANLWTEYGASDLYKSKDKDVSILASKKCICDMHKFRYDIAMKCKNIKNVDTYGTFDGGEKLKTVDVVLEKYRYTICTENDIQPYYFSERLISAFANQVIPIYCGASKVGEFFNMDGIIQIDSKSDIEQVLKQCTKEEYERRLPAVLDNYERAKKYVSCFDYMFENYLS